MSLRSRALSRHSEFGWRDGMQLLDPCEKRFSSPSAWSHCERYLFGFSFEMRHWNAAIAPSISWRWLQFPPAVEVCGGINGSLTNWNSPSECEEAWKLMESYHVRHYRHAK
jgi:hypothetical protein